MSGAPRLVVAGVTASGKTTLGQLLAGRLGVRFVDGDDLHGPANLARLRRGEALTDAERAPWLDAVAAALAAEPGVVACSALKRAYRDRLREAGPDVRFVFLLLPIAEARARAAARSHWAPAALVEPQFAALEPPCPEETDLLSLDARAGLAALAERVLDWLNG